MESLWQSLKIFYLEALQVSIHTNVSST